ncbi:uncharacterized [Tachysurus ichikawai]
MSISTDINLTEICAVLPARAVVFERRSHAQNARTQGLSVLHTFLIQISHNGNKTLNALRFCSRIFSCRASGYGSRIST